MEKNIFSTKNKILITRFLFGLDQPITYRRLGDILGISASRACQIHYRIIKEDRRQNKIKEENDIFHSQPWTSRTLNCLHNNKIFRFEVLKSYKATELLSFPNFGKFSLFEVYDITRNAAPHCVNETWEKYLRDLRIIK